MSSDQGVDERWRRAVQRALVSDVSAEDADAQRAKKIVTSVEDYIFDPTNRSVPYKPWFLGDIGPTDLTEDDMRIVVNLADMTDSWRLRVRCLDLIALRSAGRARADAALTMLESLREAIAEQGFKPRDIDLVTRALELGGFGPAHRAVVEQIEDRVVELIFAPLPDLHYISFSRRLREDKRTHRHAKRLACQFSFAARSSRSTFEFEEAAEWAAIAGDRDRSDDLLLDLALTLQEEARGHIADARVDSAFYASELLHRAYRNYLRTSIRARTVRALEDLGNKLTADIRGAGKIMVSHSTRRSTVLPDLSPARDHVLSQIANARGDDARAIFLGLMNTDYAAELAGAENIRKNFALLTDTPRRTIEKDGRVSAVTGDTKKEVFGVPSPLWHQMMRSHEFRVHTMVPQLLHPVWRHLHETQHWSHSDFVDIASQSDTIPKDRTTSVGTALFYGFTGDFFTAFQLLIPQTEHLVREQLKAIDDRTSRYADGVEDETSLPSLLKSGKLEQVFGVSLAFELRALFGDAGGPNLRHRVAHGQISDEEERSPFPFYVWWLVWRIVAIPPSDWADPASGCGSKLSE
ncbi:DUF4209 domain-containing protein [Microbacterium sp. CFBP 8794]|uniref:DUF4209 domain-containing protein n=1 Tax=Microbacterium sp. CFBP 8794 TaxID=2775269 RepID=UPI00177D3C03|nr:DUF4209 domain-containing protein [Microbacterium sp. CFBP 8794]MBD8478833.1 DUF4209 domain-containing protein [Microbacterium sp. CFBP 8794]